MNRVLLGAGFLFTVLLLATPCTEGQTKTKKKLLLPALAYDAQVVRYEEKKGLMTKLFYETSPEDEKKLGIGKTESPITNNTKFVFVGPDGEKKFTARTVLADAEAKAYLEKSKKIRLQVTGIEAEIVRFGPELKEQGPQRVR